MFGVLYFELYLTLIVLSNAWFKYDS